MLRKDNDQEIEKISMSMKMEDHKEIKSILKRSHMIQEPTMTKLTKKGKIINILLLKLRRSPSKIKRNLSRNNLR